VVDTSKINFFFGLQRDNKESLLDEKDQRPPSGDIVINFGVDIQLYFRFFIINFIRYN
jgi:hypothetical protein